MVESAGGTTRLRGKDDRHGSHHRTHHRADGRRRHTGIDIADSPSAADLADLRQAIVRHRVVFLRGQSTDPAGLLAVGKQLGEVVADHPAYLGVHDEFPEVAVVSNTEGFVAADTWHADMTYTDNPPLGTVLQLVTVPDFGGDTVWLNCVAAYSDLSEPLKGLLSGLSAVHQIGDLHATHPVVRRIPETDEHALYVNPTFTSRIRGLHQMESDRLLGLLFDCVRSPEYEVRWKWEVGDVAIWDNRSLWHYALADHGDMPRRGHRVVLSGESFT